MLHTLRTCHSRWQLRMLIINACPFHLEFFHQFVNFSATRVVGTIVNCNTYLIFSSFQTSCPQKSDHKSEFFSPATYRFNSHRKRVAISSLLKRQWKPIKWKERKIQRVCIRHLFHGCQHRYSGEPTSDKRL
jgi:hypothetical protein